jgi:hypothetical protein
MRHIFLFSSLFKFRLESDQLSNFINGFASLEWQDIRPLHYICSLNFNRLRLPSIFRKTSEVHRLIFIGAMVHRALLIAEGLRPETACLNSPPLNLPNWAFCWQNWDRILWNHEGCLQFPVPGQFSGILSLTIFSPSQQTFSSPGVVRLCAWFPAVVW